MGGANNQVSLKLVSSLESLFSSLNGTAVMKSISELPSSSLPLLPLELSVVFSHDSSTSWMESTDTRVGDGFSSLKVRLISEVSD